MNSKITLASLAQLLSERTGRTSRQCDDFLRAFFQQVAAAIESGEGVKIKGFGTFKLSKVEARKSVDVTTGADNEIPAHRKIVFVPSKELASAVNAPFEMFETVVLDENVLEEELMEAEASGNEVMADDVREHMILEEERADEVKAEYPAVFASDNASDDSSDHASGDSSDNASDDSSDHASGEREDAEDEPSATDAVNDGMQDDAYGAKPEADGGEADDENPGHVAEDPVTADGNNVSEQDKRPEIREYIDEEERDEAPDVSQDRSRHRLFVWISCVAAGIVAIVVGLGVLWMLNDDFAEWGMRTLHLGGSTAAIVQADENVAPVIGVSNNIETSASGVDGVVENIPSQAMQGDETSEEDDVPTRPSDTPVYDTVTDTRYLSTIAKEHYGNFNLWPYIYKENEKILGHPNRIRPGTRVVIPDLSKYGVDPKNKADIEEAKKMGMEIYARYNKK